MNVGHMNDKMTTFMVTLVGGTTKNMKICYKIIFSYLVINEICVYSWYHRRC